MGFLDRDRCFLRLGLFRREAAFLPCRMGTQVVEQGLHILYFGLKLTAFILSAVRDGIKLGEQDIRKWIQGCRVPGQVNHTRV